MSQDDHSQASSYILDAENAAEMGRLTKQDRLITAGMGGLAASYHDLADKQQLLDIACGPGGRSTSPLPSLRSMWWVLTSIAR